MARTSRVRIMGVGGAPVRVGRADKRNIYREFQNREWSLPSRMHAIVSTRTRRARPVAAGGRNASTRLRSVRARAALVVLTVLANAAASADAVEYPELPWFGPSFPSAGTRHALEPERPLRLRYRLWLSPGPAPGEAELRDQWLRFNPAPPAAP